MRLFFSVLLVVFLSQSAFGAEIDQVVWNHPGYSITVHRTGEVRVDFVQNQKGISRELIESSFSGYPKDKFRESLAGPERLKRLFQLIDSSDWTQVKASYRAAEGTFEYAGHETVTRLVLKSKGTVVKEVELGGSRKPDWPTFVLETVDDIVALATEDGRQLPRGPFLD